MKRSISETNDTRTPKKSKKRVISVTSASTVSAQKGKEVSPVKSPCICGSKACRLRLLQNRSKSVKIQTLTFYN